MEFGSDAWTEALWSECRSAGQLQQAAAGWVHGPILLAITAQPHQNWPDDVGVWIHIHEGEFRTIERRDAPLNEAHAPFVVRGSYTHWKSIFSSSSSMVDGITGGKLTLKGDLALLTLHREVLDAITRIGGESGCTYPD